MERQRRSQQLQASMEAKRLAEIEARKGFAKGNNS